MKQNSAGEQLGPGITFITAAAVVLDQTDADHGELLALFCHLANRVRITPITEVKHTVRIGGQKAKVLGGIGATQTILNVTKVKCSAGDLATFDIDPMFARGFITEYR